MNRVSEQVVVAPAGPSVIASHTQVAHHRDFPELRGEGETLEDAASRLADLLALTLESAPSDWRRDQIERAIEDVRAFRHEHN
jgi:predicted RNase H-like HicB family nuclease